MAILLRSGVVAAFVVIVCSYDRAGFAWSEPGKPEAPQNVTSDHGTI